MQFLEEFRSLASCGNYELALQSFKEFESEIISMEKDKQTSMIEGYSWKQIKNELQKELHLVNQIVNELNFFKNSQSFGPQQKDYEDQINIINKKQHKSIQERYDMHIGNRKKHTKNDRHKSRKARKSSYHQTRNISNNNNQDRINKRKSNNKKKTKEKTTTNLDDNNDKDNDNSDVIDNKYRPPSGMDNYLVETIENSVIQRNIGVKWDDIASLSDVKKTLKEVIILPTIIPEYFRGIRKPFRGILLFGLPGTGKTMLAKAVASTAKCTFFNVSPSLIISKWRGDSSKLIRILFDMARFYSPSVIFFDEIDAIASSRSNSNQHEASQQLKSELLIQMDGINSINENNRNVMVLAATNYPWALDEALRRRLEKRIYIDLPEKESRISLFKMYLKDVEIDCNNIDFDKLSELTKGYNGSDIQIICRNASMVPMRNKLKNIDINDLENLKCSDIDAKITQQDIESVIAQIKSSVSINDVEKHKQWFQQFGSL